MDPERVRTIADALLDEHPMARALVVSQVIDPLRTGRSPCASNSILSRLGAERVGCLLEGPTEKSSTTTTTYPPIDTLPMEVSQLSGGYARLGEAARTLGARAASQGAMALTELLKISCRIEPRALPARAAAAVGTASMSIQLGAFPSAAILEVESVWVARLLALLAGGGGVPTAVEPTPMEVALAQAMALAALAGIRRDPRIDRLFAPRLVKEAPPPRNGLVVELALQAGDISGRGWLTLPKEGVEALSDPPNLDPQLAGLAVPISLVHGSATLEGDEWESMERGDVVLIDEQPRSRAILILGDGPRLFGNIHQETFTVEEVAMTPLAAGLPVTLEVEIARVTVTLGELARVQPGAALTLSIPRTGRVTLRVAQRAIAEGDLVDIDGMLGVRVLRLAR
jgi:type III secretion system YscQ/HrcQ family protein